MKQTNRRKLKAHDRGEDRHNRGVQALKKRERLAAEKASRPPDIPAKACILCRGTAPHFHALPGGGQHIHRGT